MPVRGGFTVGRHERFPEDQRREPCFQRCDGLARAKVQRRIVLLSYARCLNMASDSLLKFGVAFQNSSIEKGTSVASLLD